jgi:choice-of-anchor C domain-containing protein
MTYLATALAVAVLACAATAAQASSLIINGGFEEGADPGSYTTLNLGSNALPGWVIGGNSIDVVGTYWQPSEGKRSIDLAGNGAGGIGQSFATTIGQTYHVSFDLAGNPTDNTVDPIKSLLYGVYGLSGGSLPTIKGAPFDTTHTSKTDMGWKHLGFNFVATDTTTVLAFLAITQSAFGPALDNVAVNAVPLPAALPLFAAGMAGLGAMGRMRSRRKRGLK